MNSTPNNKTIIVSRCAWTLHNFRRSLMADLHKRGVTLIALGAGGDGFDRRLLAEGVDFKPVPISLRGIDPLSDVRLLWRLYIIFRRERPAVVHSFTIKPAIYATLAAALARVPVRVVTITGVGHAFTTGRGWLRGLVERLYRMALHRADLVFFQNGDDRDLFLTRRLVAPGKVRMVAGSGVDLMRFTVQPLPSASGFAPGFLMIARLLREKGIAEYVQAAAIVKRSHPDAVFRLLGGLDPRNPSGLTEQELQVLNGSGAVEWLGEADDVRPHIADADVVVLPSYREGVPRSLLEGAAMGRALLATDAVGCREVVTHGLTGYSVPVADAEALAASMVRLIEYPTVIPEMGQAARKMVEERFDERLVIERIIAAYEDVLAKKGLNVAATLPH